MEADVFHLARSRHLVRRLAPTVVLTTVAFLVAPLISAAAASGYPDISVLRSSVVGSIESDQVALAGIRYQGAVDSARRAVFAAEGTVQSAQNQLSSLETLIASSAAEEATAKSRAVSDGGRLDQAKATYGSDQARLTQDRQTLEDIAVDMYTGQIPPLTLSSYDGLQYTQDVLDAQTVAAVAAQLVVSNVHADTMAVAAASRAETHFADAVAQDTAAVARAQQAAANATTDMAAATGAVASSEGALGQAQGQLAAALSQKQTAVAQFSSGASGSISVLGPSALDANQLVAWYEANGYADFTPASITELANWYITYGAIEGLRGDIAFAQAVLETGGFSSSDAISLNNYAGIGHCDTCSSGWAFPSPVGGVIGQSQLLRIFAGADPPPSPPPVLPALTPAHEPEFGCCSTWEALTGVWATDAFYGSEILGIYQDMLNFTLSQDPQA